MPRDLSPIQEAKISNLLVLCHQLWQLCFPSFCDEIRWCPICDPHQHQWLWQMLALHSNTQNLTRRASIDYIKPFQPWEVWWEALNEFFHWFFLRDGLRNNIQSHKAYWFRSNSHKITMMWCIEVKIWQLQVRFVTFLEEDGINDIANVKISTGMVSPQQCAWWQFCYMGSPRLDVSVHTATICSQEPVFDLPF